MLENFYAKNSSYSLPKIKDYKLIKTIKLQEYPLYPSIGIYKNKTGDKIVVKSLQHRFKNAGYYQLHNEFKVMKYLLENIANKNITVPRPIKIIEENRRITMFYRYINAKSLQSHPINKTQIILQNILTELEKINIKPIKNSVENRSKFVIGISFPIYLIILLLKDPKNLKKYIFAFYNFYINYMFDIFQPANYVFSHRDLHLDNVLVNLNKVFLIDPEVAVIAQGGTDQVILERNTFELFGDRTNDLFTVFNTTNSRSINYLRLYYSLQMMAIRGKKDEDFLSSQKYFNFLIKNKVVKKEKSEIYFLNIVYALLFHILVNLDKLFLFRATRKKLIFCYHSIDESKWGYSLSSKVFRKQIGYLLKNTKIVPLSNLLSSSKNGTSITFDDGYETIFTKAFPLLKKLNVKATVFILSDFNNPSRQELDNNFKLMTIDQIKILHSNGWEIGSHSSTHAALLRLSDKELYNEIVGSKERLEKLLGIRIKYFAYPKGKYDNRIIRFVQKAGYEWAFTVDGGLIDLRKNYQVTRLLIENNTDMFKFRIAVSDLGLYLSGIQIKIFKLKERIYG